MKDLTAQLMRRALEALDTKLSVQVTLIVGGGGAMLLAYNFPLTTTDIDAVPKGLSSSELKPFIEEVAMELDLAPDWLNPWFSSFTHVLSADYETRLLPVFQGTSLNAMAIGREDLLLMKSFAHRKKDVAHARALVRAGANLDLVYERIDQLEEKKIPGTVAAREFLDEICDLENI